MYYAEDEKPLLPPTAHVIEPVAAIPHYCSGVASVSVVGENMHFACYIEQAACWDQNEPPEHVINLRVIMPLESVVAALPYVIRKLATCAIAKIAAAAKRLMH